MENKLKESLGLLDNLSKMAEEVERAEQAKMERNVVSETQEGAVELPSINSIFEKSDKTVYKNEGFTFRIDQVKKIEKYSKMAKKSKSKFMRDILDYVFSIIESEI